MAEDGRGESSQAATGVPSVHRWTDEDTRELILWRAEKRHLFTGKRNASTEAYNVFLTEREIQGVEAKAVKKRWENLVAKYKDLKKPRTGVSTEGGEATAASWKWYSLMDDALGDWRSITPPVVFASACREVAVASPPPVEDATSSSPSTSNIPPAPKKKKMDATKKKMDVTKDILEALKEQDQQQEELLRQMERSQEAREAREEARAREAADREERFAHSMMEREERFFREMRDREDRARADMRAREDRREREAAAREERLMAILERMTK